MARTTAANDGAPPLRAFHRAASLLKLAGEPTRFAILLVLAEAEGELHVGGMRERLAQALPGISHPLRMLRHGGLVVARRGRGDAYYRLTEAGRMLVRVVERMV